MYKIPIIAGSIDELEITIINDLLSFKIIDYKTIRNKKAIYNFKKYKLKKAIC